MNQEKNDKLIYIDEIRKDAYQYSDYKKFNLINEENIKIPSYIKVNGGNDGGGYMEYVTIREFESYQKHIDTRFNRIEDKIEIAKRDIKEEISNKKVTSTRFWVGISIPSLISIVSILVSIFIL